MNLKLINNKVILKEYSNYVDIIGIPENNIMIIRVVLSNQDIAKELITAINNLTIAYKLYISSSSSKSAKKILKGSGIEFEEHSDLNFLNNIFTIK